MSAFKDLTGKKFGRLTVIERGDDYISPNGKHRVQWICLCDCGNITTVIANNLGRKTTSCGCAWRETIRRLLKKKNKYDLTGEYGKGYASNTGNEFIFDLEDYEKIKDICWLENGNGYLVNKKWKRKTTFIHRLIMDCPDDKYVDHINGNPLDNRKCNLRIVTMSQNNMNHKPRKNTISGVTGVTPYKDTGKWDVFIFVNGEEIYLGRYNTIEEAKEARLKGEEKYFGEYSYKNSQELAKCNSISKT